MTTADKGKRSLRRMTALAAAGMMAMAIGAVMGQSPAANLQAITRATAAYSNSNGAPIAATAPTSQDIAANSQTPMTQAHTMPAGPTVNVAVTEWAIFIADQTTRQMNRRDAFDNALPSFVNDGRREPTATTKPTEKVPAPMGLIRMAPTGPVNTDVAIDVQVICKTGKVLGHWPAAKTRASGVLWQDVHFATASEKPRELPAGDWLSDLRTDVPAAQFLTCGSNTEPFLLYDLEASYTVNLQIATGEGGKYKVANPTDATMLDLTFYKKAASGQWRTGTLASLGKTAALPATSATATAPAPTTKPTTMNASTTMRAVSTTRRAVAQTQVAQTQKAESQPATAPALPMELALGTAELSEDAALAPWRSKLAEAGVTANDQQLILKILAKYAMDPKRLTAVYRMDPAELDKFMQLEVVPQPKKVSRIALVIVSDIDPAVGDELNDWIKQLGDASWEKREAAMTELRKAGARAKPHLEKALKEKNQDLEITYRVEQLLQLLASPEPNEPQN